MRRAASRRAASAAALIGLVVVTPVPRMEAGADAPGDFAVVARSDLAQLEMVSADAPTVPQGQFFFASPATAQAIVDSLGTSQGFASAPYPGDFYANLPGAINGLSAGSGLPSVPDYPLIVRSSHPTVPTDGKQQGPLSLAAESRESESSARASADLLADGDATIGSTQADASATRDVAGVAVAVASNTTDALSIGGLLELRGVRAGVKLTAVPGRVTVKESSLTVASMTVAGTQVSLSAKGLTVSGNGLFPGPDASALTALLGRAGIEVAYVPAVESEHSIRSAAIRIRYQLTPPERAPLLVTLTLGQATASATSSLTSPVDEVSDEPLNIVESGEATVAPDPAGSPVEPPNLDAPPFAPADLPLPPPDSPAAASPPLVPSPAREQAIPGPLRPGRSARSGPVGPSSVSFYLALVGAGVAAVASSVVMGRLPGGRRRK